MTITAARKPRTTAPTLFEGQSANRADDAQSDDFVDDVLAIVASIVPGLDHDSAHKASRAIRERWGGDRPYIARRAGEGRSDRNASIRRDYRRGVSVAVLERRYEIGPRQILRILRLAED